MNIGERCNVAGSIMYKKAIVDGDYDKAHGIALKQACPVLPSQLKPTKGSDIRADLDGIVSVLDWVVYSNIDVKALKCYYIDHLPSQAPPLGLLTLLASCFAFVR